MRSQAAQRVEFYLRGGGLIDACRAYAVPRQGECVNINKQCYRVALVQWSVDTDVPRGTELRANVELEKIDAADVGPIQPPEGE